MSSKLLKLTKGFVQNRDICTRLTTAIFKERWNCARIISENLCAKYPFNKQYKEIDDLITNKFYE